MIKLNLTKEEGALIRDLMRVRWEKIPASEDGEREKIYDSILEKFNKAGFGYKEYVEYLESKKYK